MINSETTTLLALKWAQVYIGVVITLGAFGEVRMCQHRKMRAIRAVKILKKAALKKEEVEKFIHEIEILKTLVSLANLLIFTGSPKHFAFV